MSMSTTAIPTTTNQSTVVIAPTAVVPPHHVIASYKLAEIAVPMSVTLIVIIVLCMVVGYTKARKRRRRLEQQAASGVTVDGMTGTTASLPNTSSGVALSKCSCEACESILYLCILYLTNLIRCHLNHLSVILHVF